MFFGTKFPQLLQIFTTQIWGKTTFCQEELSFAIRKPSTLRSHLEVFESKPCKEK